MRLLRTPKAALAPTKSVEDLMKTLAFRSSVKREISRSIKLQVHATTNTIYPRISQTIAILNGTGKIRAAVLIKSCQQKEVPALTRKLEPLADHLETSQSVRNVNQELKKAQALQIMSHMLQKH